MWSMMAAATWASPRTAPRLESPGSVVSTTDWRSWASDTTWDGSLAPPSSRGRNPSSSMASRLALSTLSHSATGPPPSRAPRLGCERGRGEEPRPDPSRARQRAQGRGHVRVARADVARQHQVLACVQGRRRQQAVAPEAVRPRRGVPAMAVGALGRGDGAAAREGRLLGRAAARALGLQVPGRVPALPGRAAPSPFGRHRPGVFRTLC